MSKFQPGRSGNPRGPKPGNGPIQKLRRAIEKDLPDILSAMVEQAKAGDVQAARLLVDKVLPSVKPETRPLPAGAPVDPQAILDALTAGNLTAEQARAIMGLLVDRARIAETLETAERLARVEALLSKS
jgi:dihydrodipicolinate synthase/N-acetylneuraminate lyase